VTRPDDVPATDRPPAIHDPDFAEDILARARRRAEAGSAAPVAPMGATPATPLVPVGAPIGPNAPSQPGRAAGSEAYTTPAAPPRVAEPPTSIPELEPSGDGTTGDGGTGDDADDGEEPSNRRTRNLVEWVAVAVGALVVAFLIRAFLLQAFYIPSESMEPTLVKNDRILVNKLSYKLHDVHRGDLVVFEKPPTEAASDINDLIKRVIALPNETIEQRGNQIFIDDRLLTEPYLPAGLEPGTTITWVEGCANPATERNKCTIPSDHVWVMGDNRPHSRDSRFFGPIDDDLIVGRAFVKVWPLNKLGFL
jgi:signal peptidase I